MRALGWLSLVGWAAAAPSGAHAPATFGPVLVADVARTLKLPEDSYAPYVAGELFAHLAKQGSVTVDTTFGPYATRVLLNCTTPEKVVVVVHGYGCSPDRQLLYAQRILASAGKTKMAVLLPRGPLMLEEERYAWWPMDIKKMAGMLLTRKWREVCNYPMPGLPEARRQFTAFSDAVVAQMGVRRAQVMLVGMSQGAMLLLDHVITREQAGPPLPKPDPTTVADMEKSYALLALHSPFPMQTDSYLAKPRPLPYTDVLHTMGSKDPLVPMHLALGIENLLQGSFKPSWHIGITYDGPHRPPPEIENYVIRRISELDFPGSNRHIFGDAEVAPNKPAPDSESLWEKQAQPKAAPAKAVTA